MLSRKEVYMKKSPSYLNIFSRVKILDGNRVSYNKIELSNGDTLYFKNVDNCEHMARGVLKVNPEISITSDKAQELLDVNPGSWEQIAEQMNAEAPEDRFLLNNVSRYNVTLKNGEELILTWDHSGLYQGIAGAVHKRKNAELFGSDVRKVIDSDPAVKNKYFGGNAEFI